MIHRTIEKNLSTPAVARQTARWAMRSASNNPNGSYYALITAKVFTAFMFEGVVDHLGEILCSTWSEPGPGPNNQGQRTRLARQPLVERHKAVRRLLQLDNGSRQYQDIHGLVGRVLSFRDSFAHPKGIQETVWDSVQSDLSAIPDIAWETEVDAAKIENDLQELENYSMSLLDSAAASLDDTLAKGWDVWQQRYPHLTDLHLEAACLRGFLHSSSHSLYDCSLG
jgi:hypothetical protein